MFLFVALWIKYHTVNMWLFPATFPHAVDHSLMTECHNSVKIFILFLQCFTIFYEYMLCLHFLLLFSPLEIELMALHISAPGI